MQIMRLRRKLEVDAAHPRYIKTERGADTSSASRGDRLLIKPKVGVN